MSESTCCLKTFQWDGTPTGHVGKLATNNAYITGTNPNVAILIVHDMLGWSFPNVRLLADHYATEANATVYVPDFFGGEVLPFEPLIAGRFAECARELRAKYGFTAAVGFCYGGWAVFRLAAASRLDNDRDRKPLVDCIAAAHPSMLTESDIDGVVVPTQILAPEIDPIFTPELKRYTFDSLSRRGVEHACMTRGI
ncbi:Alpha/Beta hydrolase protein [Aspergillus spectabilis]